MSVLKNRGMKGESLNTYENYFKQEIVMQSEAFRPRIVQDGYIRAGFNIKKGKVVINKGTILQACSTFNNLAEPNKTRVNDSMEELREDVEVNWEVNEGDMQRKLGDIMKTKIDPEKSLPLNQKRALCLNREIVVAERKSLLDVKKAAEAKALADKLEKIQKKAIKEAQKDLLAAGTLPNISGPPTVNAYCTNPACGSTFDIQDANGSNYSKLIGCPLEDCGQWFCHLVACSKILDKHRLVCLTKRSR